MMFGTALTFWCTCRPWIRHASVSMRTSSIRAPRTRGAGSSCWCTRSPEAAMSGGCAIGCSRGLQVGRHKALALLRHARVHARVSLDCTRGIVCMLQLHELNACFDLQALLQSALTAPMMMMGPNFSSSA
jgi:hypothetical protein